MGSDFNTTNWHAYAYVNVGLKIHTMNSVHCLLVLLYFVGPMTGVPDDYSYDYEPNYDEGDYGIDEVSTGPEFVTTGQTFLFNKGDTIRLPCFVDNLDGFIIKWSTEDLILAVGSTLIDQSFRLESSKNGNTLVIPDAGREHEGQYICETSYPTKTPEIVHTVKMRGGFLDWSWKEIGLALVSMTAGLF